MTRTFLALSAVLLCGCGGGGRRLHPVAGTVTFDGKPLAVGQIFFDPDVGKGNDGPQGFAHIKDGKFDTAEGGRGVLGGPYIVRIDGFDGRPGPEMPLGRPLFAEYQEKRDLPAERSEQQFDVPGRRQK
jgi:hypothetical protein